MTTDYAIIARVKVQQHPDPDVKFLAVGTVCNQTVIVSNNTADGELGIFFPCELQLSEQFAKANNLIRKKDPVTGKNIGGMFEENRRVRPQKFRGIVSYGFWCPLSYLARLGGDVSKLKEGTELKVWNKIPLCNKYYTAATQKTLAGSRKNIKKVEKYTYVFPEHQDTKHFLVYADHYKEGDEIIVTNKLHGTSQRVGINTQKKSLNWFQKIVSFVTRQKIDTSEVVQLSGTRRTVLNNNTSKGYHSRDFRDQAAAKLHMHMQPYMHVYFELVGWEGPGGPSIMPPHNSEKLKEKHPYGKQIIYSYGCTTGTYEIYVYRVSWVLPSGHEIDWLWDDIVKWCKQANIKHVPVLDRFIYDGNKDALIKRIEALSDGPDTICPDHPREGVCVRANGNKWVCYKNKGYTFRVLEDLIKDNPTYVDQEEIE